MARQKDERRIDAGTLMDLVRDKIHLPQSSPFLGVWVTWGVPVFGHRRAVLMVPDDPSRKLRGFSIDIDTGEVDVANPRLFVDLVSRQEILEAIVRHEHLVKEELEVDDLGPVVQPSFEPKPEPKPKPEQKLKNAFMEAFQRGAQQKSQDTPAEPTEELDLDALMET